MTANRRPTDADYERAGLFDPATDVETGRLDLLDWLFEHGLSVDDMVDALARGALGAIIGDRLLVPGERRTREWAIEASGLTPARFDDLVIALDFASIDGSPVGEISFTEAEARSLAVLDALSAIFSESEALVLVRVISSAVSRIAEAAVSLFLTDIESRAVREGANELGQAEQVVEAIALVDGLAAELDALLRRQILQAIERTRRTTIDQAERFVYRYAVGFVDLVGFTALSGSMPAPELAGFLRDFEARAQALAGDAGARIVKFIGDEVMFVATDAAAACRAGMALMSVTEDESIVPRGGLAFGEVLPRAGDYYGAVVNLAARIVDEAVPGEVLVTEALADAAPECDFEPAGRRVVKGFDDPVAVQTLRRV
ncbi:MAG: adenylate/guanylate cyclase domain-containing protein [Actinomycetota bacterium]